MKVVPVFGPAAMTPVGVIPSLEASPRALTPPSPFLGLVKVSGRKPRFK